MKKAAGNKYRKMLREKKAGQGGAKVNRALEKNDLGQWVCKICKGIVKNAGAGWTRHQRMPVHVKKIRELQELKKKKQLEKAIEKRTQAIAEAKAEKKAEKEKEEKEDDEPEFDEEFGVPTDFFDPQVRMHMVDEVTKKKALKKKRREMRARGEDPDAKPPELTAEEKKAAAKEERKNKYKNRRGGRQQKPVKPKTPEEIAMEEQRLAKMNEVERRMYADKAAIEKRVVTKSSGAKLNKMKELKIKHTARKEKAGKEMRALLGDIKEIRREKRKELVAWSKEMKKMRKRERLLEDKADEMHHQNIRKRIADFRNKRKKRKLGGGMVEKMDVDAPKVEPKTEPKHEDEDLDAIPPEERERPMFWEDPVDAPWQPKPEVKVKEEPMEEAPAGAGDVVKVKEEQKDGEEATVKQEVLNLDPMTEPKQEDGELDANDRALQLALQDEGKNRPASHTSKAKLAAKNALVPRSAQTAVGQVWSEKSKAESANWDADELQFGSDDDFLDFDLKGWRTKRL